MKKPTAKIGAANAKTHSEAFKQAFDAYFGSSKTFGMYTMTLPEEALGRDAGGFEEKGWEVAYRFGEEDGVEHLYLFVENRRTNDRLYRVHADGRVEMVGGSTEGVLPDADEAFYAEVRRRGFAPIG